MSVHSLAKEVNTLGSTALNKWQKKEWERKELEKKGFMPPPNMKVPFKMYLGMKAKQEKRQEKRRQEVNTHTHMHIIYNQAYCNSTYSLLYIVLRVYVYDV